MTSTMLRVRLPALAVSLSLLLVSFARPALAQDAPPPIPWFVIDAHATVPRFSTDDTDLALSRGMVIGELPALALGALGALGPRGPFCMPFSMSSKPMVLSCRVPALSVNITLRHDGYKARQTSPDTGRRR